MIKIQVVFIRNRTLIRVNFILVLPDAMERHRLPFSLVAVTIFISSILSTRTDDAAVLYLCSPVHLHLARCLVQARNWPFTSKTKIEF